ncbi:MAG: glutamate-cysteine ligase family protein [Bacteroidota bacterium]
MNLPFNGDDEFGRLHAAIRIILPLLPALCASSPMLDGKMLDCIDGRMLFYRDNQKNIPSVTGRLCRRQSSPRKITTNLFTNRSRKTLHLFNEDKLLDPVWVNSRGSDGTIRSRVDRNKSDGYTRVPECRPGDPGIRNTDIKNDGE